MALDIADQTLVFLALPFVAALASPVAVRLAGEKAVWLLALFPAAIFAHLVSLAGPVAAGEVFTGGLRWIPTLGVNLSYHVDGLSLVFGLLISGIGAFIVLYSGGYLKGHPQLGRFLSFIFLFMGSMLGLVMADNLYCLLVLWEMTSITSFLLIGFDHNWRASRRAALQALVVTGGGGLALIAGAVIVEGVTGVSELSLVLRSGEALRESPYYGAAFVLVLIAAFAKSAQFPLHFWLPNAMEAPTPVSAYLHSATMVKAGVYLLMRFNPVMGGTALWEAVLPAFGATTLIVGTLIAIRKTDLKLMLAYTTVASLGLLVMLTGFGTDKAIEAAVYYLVAHAFFKGGLFMVAGAIDHEAGSRDIRRLGGLRRAMPLTFAAACLAALSMSGIPPFVGFIAKEEIYAALAGGDPRSIVIAVVAIAGNALMLVVAAAIAIKPFLAEPRPELGHAHEGPVLLWAGPMVLGLLGLAAALWAGSANHYVFAPMAGAFAGHPIDAHARLHLGLSLPLLLSLLTVALGLAVFWRLDAARRAMAGLLRRIGWGPDHGFDQAITATLAFSRSLTAFVQNGRLESYMVTVFTVVGVTLIAAMAFWGEFPALPAFPADLTFYEWGVLAIAFAGILAVLWASDRLTAIVSLGIQGFAVALIFILFGAPDLSFTQFMVETLSVVILALVMTRLTLHKADHRPAGERLRDGAIALVSGAALGLVLLSVTQVPFDSRLSDFFAQNAYAIAHGRNIVNVIIVDFRGLDTLGEIAVVMVAGLAILALIRIRHRNRPDAEAAAQTAGPAVTKEAA
ncbi:MAG: Na(+)/H(+) antiporter subunit A [Alphaproteobacteria bacterium]|nr:MAG: Na(+)/H(+) antiporter subunit A [Alphaproteobacteria bacterium]